MPDRTYIEHLLPEVTKIKDLGLREKVISIWLTAMTEGKHEHIDNFPYEPSIPGSKYTLIEHVRRITQMAMAIGIVRRDVDIDKLVAGGLLHDVGKLLDWTFENGIYKKTVHADFVHHSDSGVHLAMLHKIQPEIINIISVHDEEVERYNSAEAIIITFCNIIENEIAAWKQKK